MNKHDSSDIDWAAIIDIFASEYGWTIDYIKSLDLGQIISLRAKIQKRYDQQNGAVSSNTGTVPNDNELTISDFEKMGKKHVRKDGTIEIVI